MRPGVANNFQGGFPHFIVAMQTKVFGRMGLAKIAATLVFVTLTLTNYRIAATKNVTCNVACHFGNSLTYFN